MDKTLEYYEKNAEAFTAGTIKADMEDTRRRFTRNLPQEARILDLGCGSGRDTKAFLEEGFAVDAVDGSPALCLKASELTGIEVRPMLFHELDAEELYDGIWACASILHLPKPELLDVFQKTAAALKEDGILYASFKYGDGEGFRNGRYFTDFTEGSLESFLEQVPVLRIFDSWITQDVRPGREEERWINILARKM